MNEGPPVLIGEKVFWLGSGSGLPKRGKVKWLGKLAEMGPGWAVGVELEEELPYGGIDGSWGTRKLFDCKHKHGLIVPASSLVSERRYLQSVIEEGELSPKERQVKEEKKKKQDYSLTQKKNNATTVTPRKNNAFLPVGSSLQRPNANQAGGSFEAAHRDYLTRPRGSDLQVQQGVVYSWMVDHRRQDERLFFRRMDFARREFNRSLDDGLAFESPRNSYHSSRSAGTRNRSSGIFALFKWFKKEKSEEESDLDVSSGQTSPVLPRTTSITGSVDTLFSTATANSFAYVHPLQYRPFGLANQPEIRIAVGPETNTYRNRIRERERLRYLDRNISLREKYRLYASGTLPRSVDHIHELADEHFPDLKASFETSPESRNSTLGRKKRKAPAPPKGESSSNSASNLNEIFDLKQEDKDGVKQHRRTLSEPVKYNKVYHVKGKRKAPPPPGSSTDPDVISISTTNSNSSKRSRKKRRAPSPPIQKAEHSKSNGIVNIIREATNGILDEELGAVRKEETKEETASTASTVDIGSTDVVCTDTLKLERGILKPNMDKPFTEPKICPSSPVSPRPWYKRPTSKELGSFKDKDKKKEKDRRKVEDWMLESGFPRRSFITNSNNDSRYNIFARTDKADDKRKSQISILTNISELDREAAEIIRRGKERERNLIDSHNAMYYDHDAEATGENITANELPNESPRKNSAKELISLFNAITNVTKVTVNSSFFSKEVSNIFNKDGKEKKTKTTEDKYIKGEYEGSNSNQFIEIESLDEVVHRSTTNLSENGTAEDDKPGSSSSQASSSGKIARVTIEELDEYDAERNSKSQVLYEANKQNRHLSPPIPTITEVSEGSAKSSPTSTIASNTSDLPPDVPTENQFVQAKPLNVWICPRCTLENLRWRITCEACEMWRPNPYELREKANKEAKAATQATHKQEPSKVTSGINLLYPNLSPLKTSEISTSSSTNKEPNKGIQNIEKTKELEGKLSSRLRIDEIQLAQNRAENKTTHEKEEKVNSNLKNETKIVTNDKNKPEKAMEPEIITKETTAKKTESNNIEAQMKKGKEETLSINIKENSTNQNIEIQKENIIKKPVIEFKNDLEIVNKGKNPEGPTGQQIASEEVRKARIAFFDKTKPEGKEMEAQFLPKQEETKLKSGVKEKDKDRKENLYKEDRTSCVEKNSGSILENKNIPSQSNQNKKTEAQTPMEPKKHQVITLIDDDDEKRKLKEMLIEMKHSLPKRPKPVKKSEKGNSSEESLGENKNIKTQNPEGILEKRDSPQMQTASSSNQQNSIIKPYVRPPSDEKAVAYLIQSETIIEEIKMKKPSEKVSSSVQTSGLVTQISPKSKPTPGKEILIPINIEEHVIKDGILYTSFTKDTRKIGTGTFELMRPRDFASIKEIKTDAKQSPPLYANMTDDDSNVSVKSEEATVNSSAYIDKLSKQLVRPQGVANFRARLDLNNDKNMNTLAVNRLLKRLENAIAGGNHELAAALARELAQLKVNCSVIRQKSQTPDNELLLELYVEDKISHQGPFPLKVKSTITVGELKEVVEREYEIPIRVQRWILGKQLAGDDSATLQSLGVNTDGSPIFLYLVAPELNIPKTDEVIEIEVKPSTSGVVIEEIHEDPEENIIIKEETPVAGPSGVTFTAVDKVIPETVKTDLNPTGTLALGWKCEVCTLMNSPTRPGCVACSANRPESYQVPEQYKISETEMERIHKEVQNDEQSAKAVEEEKVKNYQKLVDLEKDDLIIYPEGFECSVCLVEYEPNEGVVLRECLHVFCRTCLANTIHFSDEAEVKCPFRDNNYTCDSTLLEREIKALVTPQAYEEHLAKSIALAETKIGNAFHCKTPDCKGWCIYEDNVNTFRCPVCTHTNCLTCQAIHEGLNCKQFQEQLNNNSDMNIESKRTKEMLQEMVDRGEAMNCPTCQVVLMKKWGCDWLRCSMCKTEICWITRGPRWGPNGKGDTSGGCQCGVNGIKCHPKCTYCH